jgi:hypothetical protein
MPGISLMRVQCVQNHVGDGAFGARMPCEVEVHIAQSCSSLLQDPWNIHPWRQIRESHVRWNKEWNSH